MIAHSTEYTPHNSVKEWIKAIATLKWDGRIDLNSARRIDSFLRIALVIFKDADGCYDFWKSWDYTKALMGLYTLSELMAALSQADKWAIPALHSKIVRVVDRLLSNPQIRKLCADVESSSE